MLRWVLESQILIIFDPTVGVQLAFQDQFFFDLITTVRVQVSFDTSNFVKVGDIWTPKQCCLFKAMRVQVVLIMLMLTKPKTLV